MPTDLLWLAAAVGNSTFIEHFYDHRFHNKLYAGRRRFITQYVERFPLPDPYSESGRAIVAKVRRIHRCLPSPEAHGLQKELDAMVWEAFGLRLEKISRSHTSSLESQLVSGLAQPGGNACPQAAAWPVAGEQNA